MIERVVVTASAGTLSGLTQALRDIPIEVEEHPLVTFTEPADWAPLDGALDRVLSYGAVALTSPRAAAAVAKRFQMSGRTWRTGDATPVVWAGGQATAAALGSALGAVRTPDASDMAQWGAGGALAQAMLQTGVVSPVLFPCGEVRREELPERLRNSGVEVDEVVCYRSVLANESAARTAASRATVLIVTSPRVAELLAAACSSTSRPDLVAVGPTTADMARQAGWSPVAVAAVPTVGAVTDAVRSVVTRRRRL
jgi:uroporphyrinogen-III synthase